VKLQVLHKIPDGWVSVRLRDASLLWLNGLSATDFLKELLGPQRSNWLETTDGGCYTLSYNIDRGWLVWFERPEDAALYSLAWT
jgi:hypothetical protein